MVIVSSLLVIANGFYYRAQVFDDRIVVRTLLGTKSVSFSPELRVFHASVQERINFLKTAQHQYVTFENSDGRVKFNSDLASIEKLAELASQVEEQFVAPRLLERHHSGEFLAFGPLRVSPSGVEAGRKKVSFSSIKTISIEDGRLVIYDHASQWPVISKEIRRIPNLSTLAEILALHTQA